ncbi:helix-turn-helix transcriptional regulator [Nocardia sp. NPDC004860]|uniref:helix-turn-helix domain-containing protein n=1 Tax=Nocardia sp. NPDC004860 TaxID=3154557 RepID=UPI0033B70DD2
MAAGQGGRTIMPDAIADQDGHTDDTASSTLPRRQLGRMLREAREASGMSLEAASRLMEWGKSTLGRLEKGQSERVRVREVIGLGELYGVSEEKMAALKGLAQQAPARSWWHAYGDLIPANFNLFVGLEASARELAYYQPLIVPGILQTADYARALDRRFFPHETNAELDRRIELRQQRQNVILRKRQPASLITVLNESAVRTRVGDGHIMSAQLRRLADLGTQSNIQVQLLPYRAGFPLGMPLPSFTILDFGRDQRGKLVEPSVVFAESYTGAMYFERVADVGRFRTAFQEVLKATLGARPTRDLLREIAREHENDR